MTETVKIGRNEPCLCGSGKKYKKCCGSPQALEQSKKEKALEQAQMDLMRWTFTEHKTEIDAHLKPYYEKLDLTIETKQMFQLFASTWYATCALREGRTLAQAFIEKNEQTLQEKGIFEPVKDWVEAVPSVFRVTKWDDAYVLTEDIFTGELKRVKINDARAAKDEGIALGTILPGMDGQWIFLATFFKVPASTGEAERIEQDLKAMYEANGSGNPKAFMAASFLEALERFMFGASQPEAAEKQEAEVQPKAKVQPQASAKTDVSGNAGGYDWQSPDHEEVAQAFQAYALGYDLSEQAEQLGMKLWHAYCEAANPKLRKPEVAVAALVYLVDSITGTSGIKQAELARIYEISATSISSRYKSMTQELEEQIAEARENMPVASTGV